MPGGNNETAKPQWPCNHQGIYIHCYTLTSWTWAHGLTKYKPKSSALLCHGSETSVRAKQRKLGVARAVISFRKGTSGERCHSSNITWRAKDNKVCWSWQFPYVSSSSSKKLKKHLLLLTTSCLPTIGGINVHKCTRNSLSISTFCCPSIP